LPFTTFTDFVTKKELHLEIGFQSQQVARMTLMMKYHFMKAHEGEPIPNLANRRVVISEDRTISSDFNSNTDEKESMEIVKFERTGEAMESDSSNDVRSPSPSLYKHKKLKLKRMKGEGIREEQGQKGLIAEREWNWMEMEDVETYALDSENRNSNET
jgi:hypothetical protein